MSDNGTKATPAAIQIARPTTGNPTAPELATLERLGDLLHKSGFAKGARTREQAVALVLMGREMGIPAMQALSTIHVIEGKPTAGVHVIGALLARGGVRWRVAEHTHEVCTIVFERPGWQPATARFTLADARGAGLAGKDNWRKYPRNMLYARAFTEGARIIAPDLCCGLMYTPEEIAPDLAVDPDTGEVAGVVAVVEATAVQEPPPPDRGEESQAPQPPASRPITDRQRKRAWAIAQDRGEEIGVTGEAILRAVCGARGVASSKDIGREVYDEVCAALAAWEPEMPARQPGDGPGDERNDG